MFPVPSLPTIHLDAVVLSYIATLSVVIISQIKPWIKAKLADTDPRQSSAIVLSSGGVGTLLILLYAYTPGLFNVISAGTLLMAAATGTYKFVNASGVLVPSSDPSPPPTKPAA